MCLLDSVRGRARGRLGMDLSTKGKKARMPIVAQPWAQLMGTAKTLDTSNAGLKHPRCVLVRLQGPVRHAKGERGDGQRIAARELGRRRCPLQDIDPFDRVPPRLGCFALFVSLAPCAARTAPSSVNTALTAASPDVFRNARLLGPFDLSFAMFGIPFLKGCCIRIGLYTRDCSPA